VPVDVIGGTSIGAVMGALYAQGLPHAERVQRALRAFTRSGSLVSPTLPLVALSSGTRVDKLLADHFGSTSIENLPLRFFCVSANLTRAEEVVHERGQLWQAVRASLSLTWTCCCTRRSRPSASSTSRRAPRSSRPATDTRPRHSPLPVCPPASAETRIFIQNGPVTSRPAAD